MADYTLLIIIVVIVLGTAIATFLRGRSKDRCLVSFRGFMVTLLEKNGRRVWGRLSVEESGIELVYAKDYWDKDHAETSYIVFKDEFGTIDVLIRFHDELSEVNQHRRIKENSKAYHPWLPRLLARKAKNVINTFRDVIMEVSGLALSRVKTANPALNTIPSQQQRLSGITKDVTGYVGKAYDPILEKHIGNMVVLEITRPSGEIEEHVGVFKEYTQHYLQAMDVSYPDRDEIRLCDIIVPRAQATIRHGAEALNRK